jgi:ribosomal-protein-alanine N-acetyltransferase
MLLELVERLKAEGLYGLNLEVRASNGRAIGFYRAFGFQQTGLRPRYYSNPEEDAVLFRLDLR